MKKNWVYGAVTVCVALMLLLGAWMATPGQEPDDTQQDPTASSPSDTTGAAPSQSQTAGSTATASSAATVPSAEKEPTILFLTWPEFISGGEMGRVIIQGKPETVYSIQVFYKSGPSGAKGLEDKLSDADGLVTWTWKVSKNVSPGTYKIAVTDGMETATVSFTVLDQE